MTALIVREPLDIIQFVGMENEQILVSFANNNDVYKLTLDLTDGVSWALSPQAAWVSSMA